MSSNQPFVALLKTPSGAYVAPCRIGRAEFPARCDTGAEVCVITRDVARRSGMTDREIDRLPSGTVSTGSGTANAQARVAHLDWSIDGKLHARNVETWIVDGTRCLIGDPLISRFEMIKTRPAKAPNEVMFLSER